MLKSPFLELDQKIEGSVYTDSLHKAIYATDASVYRVLPQAVCYPKNHEDISIVLEWANQHNIPIIPRSAGTSLAGQCVGEGLILDVSKFMNKILEVNPIKGTAILQPGVVRDSFNAQIKETGLFFGPNTSTSNRCTIGGMIANNSSGSTSIQYGCSRDKILSAKVVLSDGSSALIKKDKIITDSPRGKEISIALSTLLSDEDLALIQEKLPPPQVRRRNSGYALEHLFPHVNSFEKLLAGSEGTLAILTEIEVQLDPQPPSEACLICPHFHTIEAALDAVKPLMGHELYACELMDKTILDCTRENENFEQNRFFLDQDPEAVLILELRAKSQDQLSKKVKLLKETIFQSSIAYSTPIVEKKDMKKVWDLRKAGLGLLANLRGGGKAVACIEDTAVALEDLSAYIKEFTDIMRGFGQKAVYYAHAGAGELHLRPILDLKTHEGKKHFRAISKEVALLVKKYKGSLSGEHGDGRVRSEFLSLTYGEDLYNIYVKVKDIWDPKRLLNPNKIVEGKAMDEDLRDDHLPKNWLQNEYLVQEKGLYSIVDRCNGSGDCRKGPEIGSMCPSYKASLDEKHTTRARANAFREFMTQKDSSLLKPQDLKEVLKHCVGCKACATECPSKVDIAFVKSAFLNHFYKHRVRPLHHWFFGFIHQLNPWFHSMHSLTNSMMESKVLSSLAKKILQIHPQRKIPTYSSIHIKEWIEQEASIYFPKTPKREVVLIIDEFNKYNRPELLIKAFKVLCALNIRPLIYNSAGIGRALLSLGFVKKAKALALDNLEALIPHLEKGRDIISLEPSINSCFWDDYKKILPPDKQDYALQLAQRTTSFSTLIQTLAIEKEINSKNFNRNKKTILLHTHCHEKALGNASSVAHALSIPEGFEVQHIPSSCCGMAGAYGMHKDHFEMSRSMAELTLLPTLRNNPNGVFVSQGFSCSHQVEDFLDVTPYHPVEVFWEIIKKPGHWPG